MLFAEHHFAELFLSGLGEGSGPAGPPVGWKKREEGDGKEEGRVGECGKRGVGEVVESEC